MFAFKGGPLIGRREQMRPMFSYPFKDNRKVVDGNEVVRVFFLFFSLFFLSILIKRNFRKKYLSILTASNNNNSGKNNNNNSRKS